ncbi:MAG: hypothetical protein WC509_03355 [Candidatus Izemoplasmatales bacterium]
MASFAIHKVIVPELISCIRLLEQEGIDSKKTVHDKLIELVSEYEPEAIIDACIGQ